MLRNSTEEIAGIKNVIDFLSEKVDEPMHATKEISVIPSGSGQPLKIRSWT